MLSTRPSLILKRRIKAAPTKSTPPGRIGKMVRWFGSDQGRRCARNDRESADARIVFRTLDGETHDVSGTYLKSYPTGSWPSPGTGPDHTSANRG